MDGLSPIYVHFSVPSLQYERNDLRRKMFSILTLIFSLLRTSQTHIHHEISSVMIVFLMY